MLRKSTQNRFVSTTSDREGRNRARVSARVVLAAILLSLYAASPASAVPPRLSDPTLLEVIPGGGGIVPRNFLGTGFEATEGFALGTISNQNGWNCLSQNNIPPLCGGNVVAEGNGSAQSFQLSQNFAYPNVTVVGARSPTITSVQLDTLNWDFLMDDNGGASYIIQPQTPSQNLLSFKFEYSNNGYIYAWGVDPAPPNNMIAHPVGFWDTNWTTYQAVLVRSDPNPANWYYNAYSGPDEAHLLQLCDINTGECNFLLAGTQYEEVLLLSDNNQNTGAGNFTGTGPGVAYVDNLVVKALVGACCHNNGTCNDVVQNSCQAASDIWHSRANCASVNCPTITVVSLTPGTQVTIAISMTNPSPNNAPSGVTFPLGFLTTKVTGLVPGGAAQVQITLNSGPSVNSYWKYGPEPLIPAPHWYNFAFDGTTGAVINANVITLHFVDGQRGDDDLAANGVIVDPGAPAFRASRPPQNPAAE